eukprot:scaffold16353_cov159-Isochrysis_galbana.AAC.1
MAATSLKGGGLDCVHYLDGKIYDRYKFLASWEQIKSHVIQHYVQHISHEPWPCYNEVARKMERWYHYDPRDGTGLGKREQGTLVPIDPAPTAFAHRANSNKNSSKRLPRADVRVSLTGEHYYIFKKNNIYHASLDELGEIIQGAIYRGNISDLELDTFPPTRWGNGYKGTAATQFPHPNILLPT